MMKSQNNKTSGVVYSSQHGKMCPTCRQPIAQCTCRQQKAVAKGDGIVRVSRQTKGRKGKGVTLVTGLPLNAEDLTQLAKELKQACGSGGTIKDGVIEIQGEHRDKLVEVLSKRGYTVKRVGG
ncbi:MAG: translation initiation factor Sui1 [Anaerolineales bacterium]|nr:translation initiation factor Sui1 [Anaerolineales bacterium]MCA9975555.1 translation initiation factor Sui1 [Anaerolineales bacterium]